MHSVSTTTMTRFMLQPALLVALLFCVTAQPSDYLNINADEDQLQVYHLPYNRSFPQNVTLRAAVMTNTVPLAFYDENATEEEPFAEYRGFQPDLMRRLVEIAWDLDNVTLAWELEQAKPFTYGKSFEYVANDCNSTTNGRGGFPWEDCVRLDLIVGDFYGYPYRSIRTLLTPPLLTTAAATVKFVHRQKRAITTLREAVALQEPVCLLTESYYDEDARIRFPGLIFDQCFNHTECIQWLKQDRCALFVEDQLQLRYLAVQDPDLEVTRETFGEQYILWPINARLDPLLQQLIIRWIYQAKVTGVLDELYDKYFSIEICPLGSAGVNCELNCSSAHGSADRHGKCVCESTKWTGDDCSILVPEDLNMIPRSLFIVSYLMVAINFTVVAICGFWLFVNRKTNQAKVSQPLFLSFILLGCLISTSTIFALAAQDEGDGPVPGCMAIPWLYSVGFSITFGSLFAKIRRVFTMFRAAESTSDDEEAKAIFLSGRETVSIVTAIVALDVLILLVWTIVDPLHWTREVTASDQFGAPLSSEGFCISDHWIIFTGAIAALHLGLMLQATYMCYVSRNIPTKFQEGKYLSIAMVSNLQIFVIGVPVLIILGSDPETAFFVRSAIIWMNDLVVVTVIFGNIMHRHQEEAKIENQTRSEERNKIAMQNYQNREGTKTLVSNMLLQS